jgi:hypothetical protein
MIQAYHELHRRKLALMGSLCGAKAHHPRASVVGVPPPAPYHSMPVALKRPSQSPC